MKRSILAALIVGTTLCLSSAASAQTGTYPDRPVQFVVPYPAGGPIDSLTRAFSERFKTRRPDKLVLRINSRTLTW